MNLTTRFTRGTIVRLSVLIVGNLLCYFSFPLTVRQLNSWNSDVDGAARAYDDIQIVETSSQSVGWSQVVVNDNCLGTQAKNLDLWSMPMVAKQGQFVTIKGTLDGPDIRAVLANRYRYNGSEVQFAWMMNHNGYVQPGESFEFVISQPGEKWIGDITSKSHPGHSTYEVITIHALRFTDRRFLGCLIECGQKSRLDVSQRFGVNQLRS